MIQSVHNRDAFRQQKEFLSHVCLLYGKFQLHSLKQTAKLRANALEWIAKAARYPNTDSPFC